MHYWLTFFHLIVNAYHVHVHQVDYADEKNYHMFVQWQPQKPVYAMHSTFNGLFVLSQSVESRKNLEVDGMTDERTNVFLSGQHLLVRLPEDWGIPSVTPVDTILQSKKD